MALINSISGENGTNIGGQKGDQTEGTNGTYLPGFHPQKSRNSLIDTYVTLNNSNASSHVTYATTGKPRIRSPFIIRGPAHISTGGGLYPKNITKLPYSAKTRSANGTNTISSPLTQHNMDDYSSTEKLNPKGGVEQIKQPPSSFTATSSVTATPIIATYSIPMAAAKLNSTSPSATLPLSPKNHHQSFPICYCSLKEHHQQRSIGNLTNKTNNFCQNNCFHMPSISCTKSDRTSPNSTTGMLQETKFASNCPKSNNSNTYDTLFRNSPNPHSHQSILKSPSVTTESSMQNMLSSQSTAQTNLTTANAYQKALILGNLEPDPHEHTLAQKVKLISIIAVSAFLGLFACFLTIYLVVERLWFWQGLDTNSGQLFSQKR